MTLVNLTLILPSVEDLFWTTTVSTVVSPKVAEYPSEDSEETIVGVPDNWQLVVHVIAEEEEQLIWAVLFVKYKVWVETQYNSEEPKYKPCIIGLADEYIVVEDTTIFILTCVPITEVNLIWVFPKSAASGLTLIFTESVLITIFPKTSSLSLVIITPSFLRRHSVLVLIVLLI